MKIFKKLLAIILVILTFSLCLSGCKKDKITEDPWGQVDDGKNVNLTFTHIWPEHSKTFDKIVANYVKANSNVKIDIIEKTYSTIDSALNSAWIGRGMPDVFFYWTHGMNQVVDEDRQMAMDLTPLFTDEKNKDFINQFIGNGENWSSGLIKGRYYNVPFRATGFIVYYNKTVFSKYGWEVPKNLEEFELLMDKIKSTSELIPLDCWGLNGTFSYVAGSLDVYADILSGKSTDPNYRGGRLEPSKEDLEVSSLCMDKVKKWSSKKYFGTSVPGSSTEGVEQNFLQGKSAMVMLNNNSYSEIRKGMKDEIGCFSVPAYSDIPNSESGYVSGGYDGFCISNKSKNKLAALKFLTYLNSNEVTQLFADEEGSIMANKNVKYKDKTQAEIAQSMARVGMMGTVRDWVASTSLSAVQIEASNYMLGNIPNMTAAELAAKVAKLNKQSITDTILNDVNNKMIQPTYIRKNMDEYIAWLKK